VSSGELAKRLSGENVIYGQTLSSGPRSIILNIQYYLVSVHADIKV